jgi:hypothetical protein
MWVKPALKLTRKTATGNTPAMSRARAKFTQADVGRALRAARQAGPDWVIEILSDGTIRLSQSPASNRANEQYPQAQFARGLVDAP